MAFPPKKKKPDFALLMGAPKKPPEGSPEEEAGEDPEEEASEGDDFSDDTDPMGDDMSDSPDQIDPEQAALCHRLGFSDPDQQQALIDLVKMVATPDPLKSSDSGSALPPLPESTY